MSSFISGGVAALRKQADVAVDNLAALRQLSKGQYSAATTRGYALPGDLGGASYRYDSTDTTTAETIPTVIVAADGGRWKMLRREFLLVEQCGGGTAVADNATPFNNAMTAAAAAGIGVVKCATSGTYPFASTIIPVSGVVLDLNGATVQLTAAATVAVTNQNVGVLVNSGVRNGTIDAQAFASLAVLGVLSAYHCDFSQLTLASNLTTVIALALGVNTSGATNADGNRNCVFNTFTNILQSGACGQAMRLKGDPTTPTVVTLNTFHNFNARGCNGTGVNFDSWVDSNHFSGVCRVQVTGNGGTGVVFNSGTPATDVGVYDITFDALYVDTFGAVGGRTGLLLNNCKNIEVGYFANNPQAELGSITFNGVASYYVVEHTPGTSNRVIHSKNAYEGGKDNANCLIGGDAISTETVTLVVGLNRSAAGISKIDLVGGTTYPAFGTRLVRNSEGTTQLLHNGASQLELKAQTAGGSVGFTTSTGQKILCNDTGIGFFSQTATPVAQSTAWGTPTGAAKLASFPGATATLAQTSAQLAQLLLDLKALGLIGA